MAQPPSASSTTTWPSRPPYAKVNESGYKPGGRSAPPSKRMSGTRSHRPDLDDAGAQSDLTYAPQPIIIDQTQTAPIGYLRIAADQRWLQAVIRFRARHRPKRRSRIQSGSSWRVTRRHADHLIMYMGLETK